MNYELLALRLPSLEEAEKARGHFISMEKEQSLTLSDAVVVERKSDDSLKLYQLRSTVFRGVAAGSFWGTLLGLVILQPLAGFVAGSAFGAVAGLFTDVGIDDDFIRRVAKQTKDPGYLLFVLASDLKFDIIADRLKRLDAGLIRTSLSVSDEKDFCRTLAMYQDKAA